MNDHTTTFTFFGKPDVCLCTKLLNHTSTTQNKQELWHAIRITTTFFEALIGKEQESEQKPTNDVRNVEVYG